jgi:hypothetical protein
MRTAPLPVHHEIATLVHRLGRCLDEGDFDELRTLLTDDATATTGGGRSEGAEAVVTQARRNHGAVPVQHVITDVLVDLDADGTSAAVRANLAVTFVAPGTLAPTRTLASVYRFTARETAHGWRLASVATEPVWLTGEPLPVPAAG